MSPSNRRLLFVVLVLYLAAVFALNQEMNGATAAMETAGADLQALEAQVSSARAWVFGVNSFLMYFLLFILLGPYVGDALDKGSRRVVEEQRRAEVRIENAERDLAEAKEQLGRLSSEVEALRKQELEAGEGEATKLRELATRETQQIGENTEQGVHREMILARRRVIRRVADKALEKAMVDLQSSLDDATRDRLANELIERLVS